MQRALRLFVLLTFIAAFLGLSNPPMPVYARATCSGDPDNLIYNSWMREGGLSQWGPVADGWNAFVMGGTPPAFNWVDNEAYDDYGSQNIESDEPFDAGIYQVVSNLQPGVYYHFWVGFALAAVDKSGGPNTRDNEVGRMIGVDLNGGTDPHAPSVQWGPEFRGGVQALNIPALDATFPATAVKFTVYVRAINHSSDGRHKVWFDTICMKARLDLPTATPLASATPTAAPTDTPRPTKPPVSPAPATREPTQTPTEIPTATNTPTITNTPTPSATPTDTPKPRRAIPTVSPGVNDPGGGVLPTAALLGSLGMIGLSLIGFLVLGAFIIRRMFRHSAVPAYAQSFSSIPPTYDEMEQFDEAIEPRVAPDDRLPDDIS